MGRKKKKQRKIARKKQIQKWGRLFLVVFLVMLLAFAIVGGVMMGLRERREEKPIPVLEIKLNGVTLDEINEGDKSIEYEGNTVIINADGEEIAYADVELRGRGNASWQAEKKSYRIKFAEKMNLLGMGKKRKWALIANSFDESLMRNDLAYYLAKLIGDDYPLRGEFVNLKIDDEDLGVYYLIKTMEIDKQAVDLKDENGILVEIDNAYCEEGEYTARNGDCLVVKDVVAEDNYEESMEEFLENYNDFLKALDKKDIKKVKQLVDLESFAKYFVLSEFTANPDAYITSWYLYKDGLSDKIHAGLAWDFDAAFGNRNWGDWPEGFYDPTIDLARFRFTFESDGSEYCGFDKNSLLRSTINISWTMCDLLKLPDFREEVSRIYLNTLAIKREDVLDYIKMRAETIRKDANRDAELWHNGSFDVSVNYLLEWVEKRFDFFDEKYVLRRFDLQKVKREL